MTIWSSAADTSDREILGRRLFDAARELVWRAWTEPDQVAKWWGPNGFTITIHVMDVRPGGAWNLTMHGPDGTDYKNEKIYVEVVRPERIVLDHASPRHRMTATFAEVGARTEVTMHLVFESAELRNLVAERFGAVEGMHQTLDRLGEHLAEQNGTVLGQSPA